MLIALTAAAAIASPPVIRNPDWLRRPTGEEVASVYPHQALARGISGRVNLACEVAVTGRVENCSATLEEPAGLGFGAAAIRLAGYFRMRPGIGSDGPRRAAMTIPIGFIAPTSHPQLFRPVWTAAPTFEDVAAAFPKAATATNAMVVLVCAIDTKTGTVGQSKVRMESPAGQGFGEAAKALAAKFRADVAELKKPPPTLDAFITFHFLAPSSPAFRDRVLETPSWVAGPDPRQALKLYPPQAADRGIRSGRGVANCLVAGDGGLTNCKPVSAEPEGLGFAEAAATLAGALKMNPWTGGGGPVDGASVTLPMRFRLAAPSSASPPGAQPSSPR